MVSSFGARSTTQPETVTPERKDPRRDPAAATGTVLESVAPPAYGRGLLVSIVAAAMVFALAIFASGGTEKYTGVPMTQTTGALYWGLSVLVIILVGIGAQYAEGVATRVAESLGQESRGPHIPTAWAVPAAAVATALLLVATYHNRVMLVAGPAIAFFGVAGGLFARDLLEDTLEGTERTAALIHTLVIHSIAFLGLSAVYMNKMTGWIWRTDCVPADRRADVRAPRAGAVAGRSAIAVFVACGRSDDALSARNFLVADLWLDRWRGAAAVLLRPRPEWARRGGSSKRLRERDLIEYGAVFVGGFIDPRDHAVGDTDAQAEHSGTLFDLYERMDRLEELIEDMNDLGVTSRADAERLIEELDGQIEELESARR